MELATLPHWQHFQFHLRLEASNGNHKHAIVLPPVYDFTDSRQHHLERRGLHFLGIHNLGETVKLVGTVPIETVGSDLTHFPPIYGDSPLSQIPNSPPPLGTVPSLRPWRQARRTPATSPRRRMTARQCPSRGTRRGLSPLGSPPPFAVISLSVFRGQALLSPAAPDRPCARTCFCRIQGRRCLR